MSKRKKKNKKILVSRIVFLVLILVIIISIIRNVLIQNNNTDEQILIVDSQDITDSLSSSVYISENGTLYLSMEDVKNIFDSNIYYEEESEKIITTSGTKVAAININDSTVEVNSATLTLSAEVIKQDDDFYIPITEITNVYNIEIITTSNKGIIFSLYKELITTQTTKRISLKEDTSFFSHTIQKIEEGDTLIYIEDAEKSGWIKVMDYEGNIGYVKEKNVTEKEYVRINMEESDFTSNDADINNSIEINKTNITAENLKDFASRKEIVESIISKMISNEKYTVNLNLKDVEVEEELLERFIIELIPRLKEIGGNVVLTNNSIISSEFINENNISNI